VFREEGTNIWKVNKLEPTTRGNLDWSKFGYWEHLILLLQTKDLKAQHMDLEEIEPKLIDLDWAKECYMNLNIKQDSKQHVVT
jgi:hypothetical protein